MFNYLEPCQSGLTYLFAKEAGCKSPREFESRRFRKYKIKPSGAILYLRNHERKLLFFHGRFEDLFLMSLRMEKVY